MEFQAAQAGFSTAATAFSKAAQTAVTAGAQANQCATGATGAASSGSASNSAAAGQASLGSASSSRGTSGTTGDASTISVASAQAGVTAAQLSLNQAQANLAAATMVSPIDGVVAQLSFAVGDTVSASTSVIVIGPGPVKVTLSVPVERVGLLAVGQQASIAQNSQTVSATVTSVSKLPVSGTSYSVVVTATDPAADNLLAGAPATVTVTTATLSGATLVPISAVTLDASGGGGTVQVVANGEVTPQTITVAAVGDTQVAVTEGLKPGDRVVLADTTQPLPTSTSLNSITRTINSATSGSTGTGPR